MKNYKIFKNKSLINYLIFFLIIFIFLEILSYTIIKIGIFDIYFVTSPKKIGKETYDKIINERKEITGWPSDSELAKRYYLDGSRKSPANRKYESIKKPCFAIYGDSYAFDDEVSDNEAWPNKISEIFKCPVLNYGVGSFGLDQSVLRFEEKHLLDIPALLTFIDGDFSRSLTRNYTFSVSGEFNVKSSKPIFSLSNDKSRNLILNEIIDMDFKEYNQLIKRPRDIRNLLIQDYYLPGKTIFSPLEVNFPYSITLMKLFYILSNRFLTVSTYVSWHPFFDFFSKLKIRKNLENIAQYPPSYTDYSLELNKKILYRFTDQCKLRKIKCYIIRLPYIKDFNYKWESPIEKNLKIDRKLNKYFLTIPRACIINEFNKRGIKEEEINNQLAKYMHYNATTSSVIAKCITSLISSEKSSYEF